MLINLIGLVIGCKIKLLNVLKNILFKKNKKLVIINNKKIMYVEFIVNFDFLFNYF